MDKDNTTQATFVLDLETEEGRRISRKLLKHMNNGTGVVIASSSANEIERLERIEVALEQTDPLDALSDLQQIIEA